VASCRAVQLHVDVVYARCVGMRRLISWQIAGCLFTLSSEFPLAVADYIFAMFADANAICVHTTTTEVASVRPSALHARTHAHTHTHTPVAIVDQLSDEPVVSGDLLSVARSVLQRSGFRHYSTVDARCKEAKKRLPVWGPREHFPTFSE